MANNLIKTWFWRIVRLTILLVLIAGLVDVLLIASRRGAEILGSDRREKKRAEENLKEPEKEPLKKTLNKTLNSRISKYLISERPPSDPSPYNPYKELYTNLVVREKPILKETLRLKVTPEAIFARYDVELPRDHPLFQILQSRGGAFRADRLVTDILGPVKINFTPLNFYLVETGVAADDANARFFITSHSFKPTRTDYRITIESPEKPLVLQIEKRDVAVHTDMAQIWSDDKSIPYSKTSELTVYNRANSLNSFDFHIHFPEGTPIEAEPKPERVPLPSLGRLLSQSRNPPGLGTILFGLLSALPFLLFLYWTRKYRLKEEQPRFNLKVEAVQIYLALHFVYYFVFALDDLIDRLGNPAIYALQRFQQQTITVFELGWGRGHEMLLPLLVMFVCIWPLMVVRSEQKAASVKSERRRGIAGQILLVLTLASLLVLVGVRAYEVDTFDLASFSERLASLSVEGFYGAFFSVLLIGLLGACAWLAGEVFERRKAGAALLIFLVFVVLLAVKTLGLLTSALNEQKLWTANGLVGVSVFTLIAFVLVSAFARLAYRMVTGHSVSQAWKTWSLQKRAIVISAILLISISTKFWPVGYWQLQALAIELKGLFLIALVWILVIFLKHKSEGALWLNLPNSTRQVGILLALTLFYSSTTRWNYIPIEFLFGFILLDKWLLPTKHYDRSVFSEIKGKLPQIIQKIIDFNDAEKTCESLKKELLTKVSKGELTHKQFLQKLKAQSKVVDDLYKDLTIKEHVPGKPIKNHFAKQVVLAFGPTDSAWENGKRAALYSLLFSAPWTLLFLRKIVMGTGTGGSYLIIDVLSIVIFFLLKWVSYGFIFGYFYPYIKGSNGIQKGLSLLLTIVTPTLVWTALARPLDSESWLTFGFWVLQVFVHTMLLGLIAGEYETLRQAGFRWKQLLEIHRLGALSAWASSVLIAIGAAVSALISSGAAELIATVLKATTVESPTDK